MRSLFSFLTLTFLVVFSAGCSAPQDSAHSVGQSVVSVESPSLPPRTDYCEMLERDIQGEHYGFIAGNKLYYVAGSFGAYWHEYWESETLGFTHPLFRDGRARGNAIVQSEVGGDGHDSWGWEFWRKTRSAYGTLIVDGSEHKHPKPETLDWRPDKMVANYEIAGVNIREDKFISRDDVLTTVIVSDKKRPFRLRVKASGSLARSRVLMAMR